MRRAVIMMHHQAVLLRREPTLLVLIWAGPIIFILFLEGSMDTLTHEFHRQDIAGIEYITPSVTIMFSFALVNMSNYSIFRDHIWGTWQRLRLIDLRLTWLLLGKLGTLLIVGFVQVTIAYSAAALVYGLRLVPAVLAGLGVSAVLSLVWWSSSLALVSVSGSLGKVNALTQLGLLLMGGLGGGFVPVASMPEVLQWLARATPTYWAIDAMLPVSAGHIDAASYMQSMAVVFLFAIPPGVIVLCRRNLDERRRV